MHTPAVCILCHATMLGLVCVALFVPIFSTCLVPWCDYHQIHCGVHSLHAFCGHWVLCLWDHGCVLPYGIPLPPMVHQHKGDGHGQAMSEQETVHAVHVEVSCVCRNGALHAGALCVHCVSDGVYFDISLDCAL